MSKVVWHSGDQKNLAPFLFRAFGGSAEIWHKPVVPSSHAQELLQTLPFGGHWKALDSLGFLWVNLDPIIYPSPHENQYVPPATSICILLKNTKSSPSTTENASA